MKTLVILSETPDDFPKYAIVEGDLSHLHKVYINFTEDESKTDELLDRFYGGKEGQEGLNKIFTENPPSAPFDFDFIIDCGFCS